MWQSETIRNTIKRFKSDVRGNVAIIFGLSALPMMLAAGAAMDMMRDSNIEGQLQAALDAGALAAAATGDLPDSEREEIALRVFSQNFKAPSGTSPDVSISVASDAISMSGKLELPTAFMRVVGINSTNVSSSVTVSIPEPKTAEIVLALDYSGSMTEWVAGGQKYVVMREAAIEMVEDLTQGEAADRVKFGLVPFSHHVQVTLPGKYVVGADPDSTWSGCTQDRMYPYNTGVSTPDVTDDATKWGQAQAPEHKKSGCGAYIPNDLIVKPVSDRHDEVTDQLSAMVPYAWTHIALGFEFAWHLLTPNAPFTDVADPSDDNNMKVIVLLTDGRQTEPAFGPGASRNVAQGEDNLEALCQNAKDDGIRVITVAFDLQHKATENRLKGCATDPDKDFFIADDGADIANTFQTIKAQLQQAIYISK